MKTENESSADIEKRIADLEKQIENESLLFEAMKNGDRNEVKQMLDDGANPNARRRPDTPKFSFPNGEPSRTEVEKELKGVLSEGPTALICAVANRQVGIVAVLLQAGADPNLVGEYEFEHTTALRVLRSILYHPSDMSKIEDMLVAAGAKP